MSNQNKQLYIICVDFNTLTVGSLTSIGRWTNLETNDECIFRWKSE